MRMTGHPQTVVLAVARQVGAARILVGKSIPAFLFGRFAPGAIRAGVPIALQTRT